MQNGNKRLHEDDLVTSSPTKKAKILLEDEASSDEDSPPNGIGGIISMRKDDAVSDNSLRINEAYAKRFEYNRKREELHRCMPLLLG